MNKDLAGCINGMSAKCIAEHLTGGEPDGSYPHDAGDFGRCEALLAAFPQLRVRLLEMAEVNDYWAALAPRWEEIRAAQNQNEIISSIVRPIEDRDPKVARLGGGITIRFN
ncbi:hypothetical protein [Polycladidibacter hongkongensis]|uniref:hypothetical protein n=1 Tax=Polycladidibacter hongkongensis TaxID=1647556 RepID=UPI0008300893|nr:hypothetical protein [Pseudovibrio hongkongensis]